MDDVLKALADDWNNLDDSQLRIMLATARAYEDPILRAKLHEYDEKSRLKEVVAV